MSLRGMYADIADNTVGVMHMTTSFTSTRDLRYPAPDVARGLMLLLIAMANVPVWVAKNLPTVTGARFHPSMADSAWLFIRMLFVDHRVYPLFAMLFGFGLMTMINRRIAGGTQTFLASLPGIESGREPTPQEEAWARERATVDARRLVRRRGWWMLLFGFVHGIVFPGDIIGTYGLVAVLLAGWLARKQFRQLVVAGTIATLTEIALLLMIGFLSQGESATGAGGATTSEQVLLPWFITNPGSWAVQTLMGAVGLILLAVVIGARLADTDLIVHPERHRSLLVVVAVGGLLLGALGALPMTLAQMGMMPMPFWSNAAQNVFGLAGGCGWLALLVLYAGGPRPDGRLTGLRWLASAVGRRSMTVYLSQTMLFGTIFVILPALIGQRLWLAPIAAAGVAVLAWLLAVGLCVILERGGYSGPFETLLRTAVARSERKRPHPAPRAAAGTAVVSAGVSE